MAFVSAARLAGKPLVCVTGSSGFIASHLVENLLSRGYYVRGTIRSEAKASHLRNLADAHGRLELVDANLREEGSFDAAVKDCQAVFHTASPFYVKGIDDYERQLIEPAVNGTLNVLNSVAKAGDASRVVLTSSITSAMFKKVDKNHVWSSDDWSDVDYMKERKLWYPLSKTLAEKAAWDFVGDAGNSVKFDMVSINPTLVIGPQLQANLNTSTEMILAYLNGRREKIRNKLFHYVDVRDCAEAHVRAMTSPHASGNRYLCLAGVVPMVQMVNMLRRLAPTASVPTEVEEGEMPALPVIDNMPVLRDLGIDSYRSLETSLADTVSSLRRSALYREKY